MGDWFTYPPYVEAVEKESLIRDAAFMEIPESIAGFEVRPLTLNHLLVLRMMRSPLLLKSALPSPVDLCAFLWLVSVDYQPGNEKARNRFMARCRFFVPPLQPLFKTGVAMAIWQRKTAESHAHAAAVIDAARAYMEEAFMDKPARAVTAGYEPGYYSDAASFCSIFGREFGWDDSVTMDKPIKRLFQYLKAVKDFHNPKAIHFNPLSDRQRNLWLLDQDKANRNN